jgi:hypothetical protein
MLPDIPFALEFFHQTGDGEQKRKDESERWRQKYEDQKSF